MKRANRKIELTQKDDYSHTITFYDSDGNVKNYSTSTWEGWIGDPRGHVEKLTIDSSGSASGIVVISLSNEKTLRLPRNSFWELRMTVAGSTLTLIGGEAIVERKVGP